MGQGLFIKVAQVVAEEFGVDLDRIKITPTTTAKVPNTSATAASSGSDLNGMAARAAADGDQGAADRFRRRGSLECRPSRSRSATIRSLSATRHSRFRNSSRRPISPGYRCRRPASIKTPDIHWDQAKAKGRPFYYFAYGAACSEVLIDTFTGEMKVTRVDILHDVGRSLNPAIDIGQIEGGFVQGMGWLTTEELVFDADGPAAHPCAVDLQDSHVVGCSGRFPGCAVSGRKPRKYDLSLKGGRGTAADAGDFRTLRAIADAIHSLIAGKDGAARCARRRLNRSCMRCTR